MLAAELNPDCDKCSTPFGDIDGFTQTTLGALLPGALCSTPFGDIDGFTSKFFRVCVMHCVVLNAFRRH